MTQVKELFASFKGLDLVNLPKFVRLLLFHLNLLSISFWMTLRLALSESRREESADLDTNFTALGLPQVGRVHPTDCLRLTKGSHLDRSPA